MTEQDIVYMKGEADYMPHDELMETADTIDEADEQWKPNSVRQLLDLYLDNIEKFRNPKIRKKTVWIDISSQIGVSPEGCDKKFRNLKQTYLSLLKKKLRSGGSSGSKWPYFEIFEEIFCVGGKYLPKIEEKLKKNDESSGKTLSAVNQPMANFETYENIQENSPNTIGDEIKRKIGRKRYVEFKKVAEEMKERQKTVEAKLDRLIGIVEESNNIQRERNRLFQEYLNNMNNNS